MFLHVKEAKYVRDYVIWLRFSDGAEGEIDLEGELEGEMFAPLKDERAFRRFRVDPELETIVWENGTDLAPEFLYEHMKVLAQPLDPTEFVASAAVRRLPNPRP